MSRAVSIDWAFRHVCYVAEFGDWGESPMQPDKPFCAGYWRYWE